MNWSRLFLTIILPFFIACGNSENQENEDFTNWEMNEVFFDQTPELLEDGGYCPYYYRDDTKLTDSLEIEGENSVVAIIIEPEIKIGKTKAAIWVSETKQELLLKSDKTTGTQKYIREFENKNFNVKVDMRLVEVIDGMGEGDMLRYSGTMTVTHIESKESKQFKIQGGC